MSPKEQYAQKLRDPRWQKLRLEVFQRDGFACCACKSKDKELHVHHLVYTGSDPWDSDLEHLETLCSECHRAREEANKWLINFIKTSDTGSLLGLRDAMRLLHDRFVQLSPQERKRLLFTTNVCGFTAWLSETLIREAWSARESKRKRKPAK